MKPAFNKAYNVDAIYSFRIIYCQPTFRTALSKTIANMKTVGIQIRINGSFRRTLDLYIQ